jgi:hypothetical protein
MQKRRDEKETEQNRTEQTKVKRRDKGREAVREEWVMMSED